MVFPIDTQNFSVTFEFLLVATGIMGSFILLCFIFPEHRLAQDILRFHRRFSVHTHWSISKPIMHLQGTQNV